MNRLIEAVRSKVPDGAIVTHCVKDKCSVDLRGASSERVIVDFDKVPGMENVKRCDLLFVGRIENDDWVVLMEFKIGKPKASEVVKQLQGGARIASQWLPAGSKWEFVPVLAHEKGMHRRELETFRNIKITLNGRSRQPVLIRCGDSLLNAR